MPTLPISTNLRTRSGRAWMLPLANMASKVARIAPAPTSRAPPAAAFEPVEGASIPFLGEAWQLRLGRGNNRVLWHEQGPDKVLELALRGGTDARQLLLRGLPALVALLGQTVQELLAQPAEHALQLARRDAFEAWQRCATPWQARLTKALRVALAQSQAGAETRPGTPADFGHFIRDEKARWAKVVKDSGAKFE